VARRRSMVVALLLLAACGGDGAAVTSTTVAVITTVVPTTTAEAGFEVTSEDGAVTVHVPASAMTEDPGITITRLETVDYPPGLGVVADDPTARVYDLGPDGTEFDAPITVSLTIDLADLPDLAPNEIPAYLLFTTSGDGFEMYRDLAITRHGSEAIVSGTVSHFSPLIAVRETATPVVAIDRTDLEATASLRSFDQILDLMTEVPGRIPIAAGFRDQSGATVAGQVTFNAVDGVPATVQGSRLDIRCEEIAEIEVLPSFSAVYGSDAIAGVVNFITTRQLFPESQQADLRFAFESRVRCFDPSTSVLGIDLSGVRVATDHPGGTDWIPDRDFQGGISASFVTAAPSERLSTMYVGLICDNDFNGMVDATDTMFPAYAFRDGEIRLQIVLPLFGYADYFLYMVDGSQYSGVPAGTGWTVADGLDWYQGMHTGPGRFEASLGIVGGGDPFVYTVDAGEPEVPLDGTRLEYLDLFRAQIRF